VIWFFCSVCLGLFFVLHFLCPLFRLPSLSSLSSLPRVAFFGCPTSRLKSVFLQRAKGGRRRARSAFLCFLSGSARCTHLFCPCRYLRWCRSIFYFTPPPPSRASTTVFPSPPLKSAPFFPATHTHAAICQQQQHCSVCQIALPFSLLPFFCQEQRHCFAARQKNTHTQRFLFPQHGRRRRPPRQTRRRRAGFLLLSRCGVCRAIYFRYYEKHARACTAPPYSAAACALLFCRVKLKRTAQIGESDDDASDTHKKYNPCARSMRAIHKYTFTNPVNIFITRTHKEIRLVSFRF
jgi:hypothetical protein